MESRSPESPPSRKGFSHIGPQPTAEEAAHAALYDGATFFDSYYRALNAQITDRGTIGSFITELDSRFHYNVTENAILRGLARLEPLPRGGAVRTWEFMRRRQGLRLLDIGSGAGHWIEFFRATLYVAEAVGCEIAPPVLDHLRTRFAGAPGVSILHHDIAAAPIPQESAGEGFDYVSAIGVMFHIVDDTRWLAALRHLAAATRPGGLLFIGGEFGAATRNVQFHKTDRFDSFEVLRNAATEPGYRVNKKVRALADWCRAVTDCGLLMIDLIRTESDPALITPENDLLVLQRPAPSASAG